MIMARMKDLLYDLENYDLLNADEQKTIREIYNITLNDVETLKNINETISEIKAEIGGEKNDDTSNPTSITT